MEKNELILCLELSQLNLELSKAEALNSAKPILELKKTRMNEKYLIANIMKKDLKKILPWLNKLAFTKNAYILTNSKDWVPKIKEIVKELGKENPNFKVIIKTKTEEDKDSLIRRIAKEIVNEGLAKKASFKNSFLEISAFCFDKLLIGIKPWENTEDFNSRKAHKKKVLHPTSMDPRLARAMINLAAPKKEILDPFCGGGGILEEAKHLELNYFGGDANQKMLNRAATNLGSDKNLFLKDYQEWNKEIECVITDPPYGKNSYTTSKLSELLKKTLRHYSELTNKIIIMTPNDADIPRIKDWNTKKYDVYQHRTLTRRIHVMKKKKKKTTKKF